MVSRTTTAGFYENWSARSLFVEGRKPGIPSLSRFARTRLIRKTILSYPHKPSRFSSLATSRASMSNGNSKIWRFFLRVGLGVDARELGHDFIKSDRRREELFCLFVTACDAGVARKD